MAQLKNLLVTGVSRFLNKIYASEFVGNLTGNVTGNVSGTASNVTGTVDISHGGTNATTAANARTNLGLGSASTHASATSVGNNSNLPTGAAIQTYVTGLGYTKNTGTVTKVSTGVGLTGGDVTTTGTIKAKLKSETASTLDSAAMGSTSSRQYAVGVDKSGYLSVNIPWTDTKALGSMTGTLDVDQGGTGATTLASGEALIGNGTGAVTTRAIRNNTSNGTIGWTSSSASTSLLTQNDVAYWNGAYSGTSSNLQYTKVGELKAAATYEVETTVANDAKLPTGAAVQAYVTGLGYTKNTGTVTKVTAGDGLTGGNITTTGTIALDESGVSAGSAGPTAAVTGNDGTTVAIPRLTVDTYGRVTALSSYNLTNKNTTYSAATTSANGLMSSTDKSKLNNTNVFYGTCATAASTAAKVVELTNGDNFQLIAGAVIGVKFSYSNSASNVTINVENTGAKSIWYDRSVYTGNSTTYCGYANRIFFYMYDGEHWVWMHPDVNFNDNTVPSAYCSTAAGTAAKAASCSGYMENRDQTIQVVFTNTNTAASELTLNINSRGAHPIWIDGMASSSSNYEIPAGSYMAYYDHTQNIYHIRTDARLPVDSVTNLTNADFAVVSIVSSSQHSISGGGITNVSFNIYKPGWCALTITGYNCANANVFIITMNPVLGNDYDPATRSFNAGASVTLAYGNKASSTQNFTPQIDVLYMRLKGRQVNSNYWGMDGTTIWDGA